MSTFEDRLRRELAALADVLAPAHTANPQEASDAVRAAPREVVELDPQPGAWRARWLVPAAAVVIVAAGVVAVVITTSDRTEVTTTSAPVIQADQIPPAEDPLQADETGTDVSEAQAQDGTSQTGPGSTGDTPPGPPDTPGEQAPTGSAVPAEDRIPEHASEVLSVGPAHACAIADDATISCWGDNEFGQADAPAGAYWAVSAGGSHSCALAVDTTVICWGSSEFGQADAPAGPFFKAVSAGGLHSCAIATDGRVVCWGDSEFGQSDAPTGAFMAVSAGTAHSCAVASNGKIDCWGGNDQGQAIAPPGAFETVSAGESHSCAIATDGRVVCWGDSEFGQSDAPAGAYNAVSAGGRHSCALAIDGTVVCWGDSEFGQSDAPAGAYKAVSASGERSCALDVDGFTWCWSPIAPPDGSDAPEAEPVPESAPAPERGAEAVRPGEGVRVVAGRADWTSGYFLAALHKQLLEELGYEVTDPADFEMGVTRAYAAIAQGDMDFWPNSWYPSHYVFHWSKLPDGSLVGDHLTVVGEQVIAGGLQGLLVTKSFADAYGVYTIDELNRNADALAAYDATDPVPGNGKAEIFGCPSSWNCNEIIANQIAFSGLDNIVQVEDGYGAMLSEAVSKADAGDPFVAYTWTPSSYITQLRPGDNVYWLGYESILDDSNPTGATHGEHHDQRGRDGTGGFAAIGSDQCPSGADRPDGKCPIGWLASDILVTGNFKFLQDNPSARALFEAVRLTMLEVSLASVEVSTGQFGPRYTRSDPDDIAARWIGDNRDRVDEWLAAARAAA